MKHDQRGLTMVEILVAAAVFGVVVVAIASYYPAASKGALIGRSTTFAVLAAQQRMEEVFSKAYASVTSANFPNDTVSDGVNTYARTVTITDCSGDATSPCESSARLKKVVVGVSWTDAAVSKSINYSTLIVNN
ncbi:MAG: prepilin-type N-terminal cleavage/methylation domain-containing protein [Armatimonadetes bacterium]|nr:prepilin-type N-terminal cleavage/methylation domain-containing protein [Armatimonadota bacterium]